MKFDPQHIGSTTKIDIEEILSADTRGNVRNAISDDLNQRWLMSPNMVVVIAMLAEFACTMLVATASALHYPGPSAFSVNSAYLAFSLIGATLLCVTAQVMSEYKFSNLLSPVHRIGHLIVCWLIAFVLLAASIFLLKSGEQLSRIWIISWASAQLLFFLASRLCLGAYLRHLNQDGHFNRSAVLVGGGENAARVIAAVESAPESGVNLIGIFDDRDDARAAPEVRGLVKLGKVDDLIDFVRRTPVDTLIITLPHNAEDRLLQIVNKLWVLPVNVRLSAQSQKVRLRPRSYSFIGNLPCLDVFDKPLGEWGSYFKAAMDRGLSALFLLVFSPVLALVALAVKLDSKGPVLFTQKRYGFNNELIEVYKFRSMRADKADADASALVTKGDMRVTRVGRFIRRTSLDELPQLINVVKGDLSLVGPRPHATQAKAGEMLYEYAVDGYFARHRVKPGITGWAQINGWRGETDTVEKIERRVEHDLFYIENWSLIFDLYILARTPFAMISAKNAY